jgi:hypothetical protein
MDWLDAMVHIWTPVDVSPLANAGYGSDPRRWNRVEVPGGTSPRTGPAGTRLERLAERRASAVLQTIPTTKDCRCTRRAVSAGAENHLKRMRIPAAK